MVPALRAGDRVPASADQETPQPPSQSQAPVGFLAHDKQTYASCIVAVLRMGGEQRRCMARAGRQRAAQFSHEKFAQAWMTSAASVLPSAHSETADRQAEAPR